MSTTLQTKEMKRPSESSLEEVACNLSTAKNLTIDKMAVQEPNKIFNKIITIMMMNTTGKITNITTQKINIKMIITGKRCPQRSTSLPRLMSRFTQIKKEQIKIITKMRSISIVPRGKPIMRSQSQKRFTRIYQ
jgi:hypothetical protein